MAVATQEVFYHTDALVEIWDLGAATPARTLVQQGDRFGVSLTNTTGVTPADSITVGDVTISRAKQAGVGNDQATAVDDEHAAGVAVDGTWEFEGITGVTASTAQGTAVYVDSDGDLTTTAASNTKLGVVNFPATYLKAAGVAPVKIGA